MQFMWGLEGDTKSRVWGPVPDWCSLKQKISHKECVSLLLEIIIFKMTQ